MDATSLEHALARIVRHLRGEAEARARLQDQRISAIEARVSGDTIAAKVFRGQPIGTREWLDFVRRIQP